MSRQQRSVVVTGLGPVTAAGTGVDELRAGLRAARSPVRTVRAFDPSPFRSRMAAEIPDFEPTDFMHPKTARRTDRFVQLALAATRLALEDAGLGEVRPSGRRDGAGPDEGRTAGNEAAGPEDGRTGRALEPGFGAFDLDPMRTAVQLGSAMGGIAHAENQLRGFLESGARSLEPRLATTTFAGAASCQIAVRLGISGPNSTNAMSCAAGTMAIGEGARLIRDGVVDVALAGGADAPLAPVCYGAFAALRAMSTRNDAPDRACRPFDDDRDGFVMGEGACVLVLEDRARAEARGARIYAQVAGYGTNNDAYHMAAPRPDGAMAVAAIRAALEQAGLPTHLVDHVNAHASSTELNDRTESAVLRQALGERTDAVSVTGTKPYHGHALGASGAMEAAIVCLSIADGWVPPTLSLERPGEGCDLDYVGLEDESATGREQRIDVALSDSFGFGGINAVLCLTAPEVG